MEFRRERSVSLDPMALNKLFAFRASLPDTPTLLEGSKQKEAARKPILRGKERVLFQNAQSRLEHAGWDTKMLEGLGLVDKETIKNLARSFEKDEARPRKTWSLGPVTPVKPCIVDDTMICEEAIKDDLSLRFDEHGMRDLEESIAREYMDTNISDVFHKEDHDVDAFKDQKKSRWSMIQSLAGKLGSFSRKSAGDSSSSRTDDVKQILKPNRTAKNRILATIKGLQTNQSVMKGLLKMSVDSPSHKAEDVT